MTRASIRLLWPLIAGVACSTDPGDAPAVTVRDSAGIRVVENRMQRDDVPVYAEPGAVELEIGVVDGDPAYSFTNVVDIRSLPDGDIVVVEGGGGLGGAQELRVFDSGGRHVRTIGRQGEGPGEFGRLTPLAAVVGDTIWTWDNRLSRLTRFSTGGSVLGDLRIQVEDLLVAELTRLTAGTYLAAAVSFSAANDADDYYVAPEPLYVLDAAGQPVGSMSDLGGSDMRVSRSTNADGRQVVMIGPVPFGRSTAYTTGPDRVYTGWNGEYRIVARSLTGDPVLVILAPGLERTIDTAEVEALHARRLSGCQNEICERNIDERFDDLRLPERRPAFSGMKVDAIDNLWVAEYEPTGDPPAGWHVFSAEGELLGSVTVPPGLEVHEVGPDFLLGVQENELGVPFVRRFELRRLR